MNRFMLENLKNLHAYYTSIPHTKLKDNRNATNYRIYNCHTSWPYKMWDKDFDTNHLNLNNDNQNPSPLLVTHLEAQTVNDRLEGCYKVNTKSALLVMHLPLDDRMTGIKSNRVNVCQDIEAWTKACSTGFGYTIDSESIKQLNRNENNILLSLNVNGEIAVTAILHRFERTIGLHQMTSLAKFRGLGLAVEMMQHLIFVAAQKQVDLFVLQASNAGAGLYRKMGFVDDQLVFNYELTPIATQS